MTATANGHAPAANDGAWRKLVNAKQEQLAQEFPKAWLLPAALLKEYSVKGTNLVTSDLLSKVEFLSNEEIRITEDISATDLTREIREKKLSSVAVTTAFAKRAAVAQQLVSQAF